MKRLLLVFLLIIQVNAPAQTRRWTEQQARDWYSRQPWLVGGNYIPATAINQLEMWQAETFDPKTIDRELGLAEGIGMNSMRVFLHDLLWQQDARGFTGRINEFLKIAARHKIRPMFVLFDSCWDPRPQLGRQRQPQPGIHNSGWVQSPGAQVLQNAAEVPRLETYVKGVIGAFATDQRVLAWDLWNEPDNPNSPYGKFEPQDKVDLVLALLPKVFGWARAANPRQPLLCGVWKGDWSTAEKMTPTERLQVELPDLLSFHSYDAPPEFEKRVRWLQRFHRPILCTEYMARGNHSTFQGVMPIAKREGVAAYNWGLVAGKTQTYLPWDSWRQPYINREPAVWFHEVFRQDGTPYSMDEVAFIKKLTSQAKASTGHR